MKPPAGPYLCTLTGVDEHTTLATLGALSQQYPFVEWGVLYSPGRAGTQGRYPSATWLAGLASALRRGREVPQFALHLCGDAVHDFLAGGRVTELAAAFPRIQLNFRASDIALPALVEALRRHPDQMVLTQHNQTNARVAQTLRPAPNHGLLFDASGGRGVLRGAWPAPFPGFACGYAGGLGPHNLAQQLPAIHAAADGAPYWIDMESSLRNELDRFDLSRARAALIEVARFRAALNPVAAAL